MDDRPSLFISAGEPSGDNAAARLVQCLRESVPGLQTFGLGGEKLAALGQEQLAPASDLAVLGFWEVAKRYLFFRKLFYSTLNEIKKRRPLAVLLVDYPGFNLRLAAQVKKLGIPVLYYISPQVWAWGKGRVKQIRANVDRMLAILPFEKEFFESHGIRTDFVGHYLVEDIPEKYIGSPAMRGETDRASLVLLPGSRRVEVERMLPAMAEAGSRFGKKFEMEVIVAGLKSVDAEFSYRDSLSAVGADELKVEFDCSRRLVYESALTVTASGTATLEIGIIGRPMLIMYKTGRLTYEIARRLVKLKMIGLVNLVMGEKVSSELIQQEASPENIYAELERLWTNPEQYDRMAGKLRSVTGRLGGPGASARAAKIVSEYLQ
ncbi:MAG: lipid-A-disaccharide synthase [bacterium]|nr:lipid-A-disaccharide synthase [bacterium]